MAIQFITISYRSKKEEKQNFLKKTFIGSLEKDFIFRFHVLVRQILATAAHGAKSVKLGRIVVRYVTFDIFVDHIF